MADLVIDDSTGNDFLFPIGRGRGLDLSARPEGFGAYAGVLEPFPSELLIPESDWQGWIEELEARKATIPDLCDAAGLKVKDQKQTNFCWANAPVHCVEIMRTLAGDAPIVLSAASVACQINGFVNRGGWGKEAIEFIMKTGVAPDSVWPNAAINRSYLAAAQAIQGDYQGVEGWELEPGNLAQEVSCVLRGFPVACGYSWWSHEVTTVHFRWRNGTVVKVIDNSWSPSWGTNGRSEIAGGRMRSDDSVCLRVPRAKAA